MYGGNLWRIGAFANMLSHRLPSMMALLVRSALPGLAALACARSTQTPAPLVIDGACQGEDCLIRFPALACADADIRATASDTAPIIARVAAGDTVEVPQTDLHVLRQGLVVVRDTVTLGPNDVYTGGDSLGGSLRFLPGDTLHLLRYVELGGWHWLRRGRLEGGMEFWAGPVDGWAGGAMHDKDSTRAVARSHPEVAWWWQVNLPGGRTGWWRADGHEELRAIPLMERWMESCPARNR